MNRERMTGPRTQRRPMDRFRAPFGFVPVSEQVICPDWADQVSHDRPFSDGICGTFTLEIHPEGPLFVSGAGAKQATPKRSWRLSEDVDSSCIPGSSLRGMLRGVLGIASFGRMHINDHRYGVRDLQNRALYGQHMAAIVDGRPTPLVSAGWLSLGPDEETPARIRPCSFAKIHYTDLAELARQRGVRGFDPGSKQSSPSKYERWGGAELEVQVQLDPSQRMDSNPRNQAPRRGAFCGKARLGGAQPGRLVFTGQPSRWDPKRTAKRKGAGNPKQHDFVFLKDQDFEEIPVSAQVWRDFKFVHRDSGQQGRLSDQSNPELDFWLDRSGLKHGTDIEPVPVFFLLRPDGSLRAIGLAMMFRLAYDQSTADGLPPSHRLGPDAPQRPDLADLIFGYVDTRQRAGTGVAHRGLKGRVSFGLARLQGQAAELPEVRAALSTPKASYYPAYVEQGELPGERPRPDGRGYRWKTWMDEGARIRGWKRYQQVTEVEADPPLPKDKRGRVLAQVLTCFRPLQLSQGAHFRAQVRVHNLRPEELGALLWAIDFGGATQARHGLGMAQPLGYGSVRLTLSAVALQTMDGDPADLDLAREAYARFMEASLSAAGEPEGWAGSRQIFELLALATPRAGGPERYMSISHPSFENEFAAAKRQGLTLEPAGDPAAWRQALMQREDRRAELAAEARREELAADPDRADREALEQARQAATHIELLRAWIAEGGSREAARKRIARAVIGKPSKKMRLKRADIVAWMSVS